MEKSTIGSECKKYMALRKKIKTMAAKVKEMESEANDMQKGLVAIFEVEELERFDVPKIGSLTLKADDMGMIEDPDKLQKYIIKNNAFELLQKRISQTAYREYREEGVKVPGLKNFTNKSLRLGWKKSV